MTSMSSVGLMAIFFVDFVDIYFLSLLGEVEIAASVGYAGSILFITTALCIGLSIGVGALTARAVGAEREDDAKRYFVHCLIVSSIITIVVSILVFLTKDTALSMLGAKGLAKDLGHTYLNIMLFSVPIIACAMLCMATLRAYAEGGLSMMATIVGGVVNAILDPILIFGFDLDVAGAAWASPISRAAVLITALIPLQKRYKVLRLPDWTLFIADCRLS
ncbi:MAG: polysaccharide biosynthesis C-terminal domain-containing protein [Oligoflexales bacterium]|nr:polysaccharide biosynthesis C-terminal domain-containing protein [Oligoflexales bacterium]